MLGICNREFLIMSSKNIAISLVILLTLFGLGLHVWYWTQLPDRMATHFGVDGKPNEWMSKTNGTMLLCGTQVGLPLLLLLIGSLLPSLPASLVSIPNRQYWLQPERRTDSIAHMATMLAWIAVLISMELIAIVHLTFLANRSGTALDTQSFLAILAIFLVGVFGIAGGSVWRFRLPKSTT